MDHRSATAPAPAATKAGAVGGSEAFARFLARTGHRVVRSASTSWSEVNRGFFMSVPSHRLLVPPPEEIHFVFRHQPCAGVRFPSPLDAPGKLSFQIECDTRGYDLSSLSANARSKVRRGLRRCNVASADFAIIAAEGIAADRDTLRRQGRAVKLAGAQWQRFWEAAAQTPGMEGWAAYVGSKMAAFLVSMQFGDGTVDFMLSRSCEECLSSYPNNALIFEVAREMLVSRRVARITFGIESLEPVGQLDQFKFAMGFKASPLRQRVVFHPVLRAILRRPAVRRLVCRVADACGVEMGAWRKVAGLVRFAEAGGEFARGERGA